VKYTIAALYHFTSISDIAALKTELLGPFQELGLCGSLLVAPEGINGTLAAPTQEAIEKMVKLLHEKTGLPLETIKYATAPAKPFNRLKIRLKKELITFKQPSADPTKQVGTYIAPKDWNELISQPDVVVLDTRNVYETLVGTFEKAIDPKIQKFTDFATYVRENLNPEKHKKIAMFCTGGIRCEKASAFMLAEGFEEVYHLQGGILKYLEEIPRENSLWNGECYVFDHRMAVGHGLSTGNFSMCFCCGYPLTDEEKKHPNYEAGVSCERCHATTTEEDKARFRMRHEQKMKAFLQAG
jgi:UPF0176 protein